MTTEQSYVGRAKYLHSSPQTAQKASKSPSTADNRPCDNNSRLSQAIADHYLDLHEAINTFSSEDGIGDTIEILTETLYAYLLKSVGADRHTDVDYARDYKIRQGHMDTIWSTLRLMVFATKVKDTWNAIESLEARQEEVQNG